MTSLVRVVLAFLVITCTQSGKATAQNLCFTSGDDCFSGSTDSVLRTYEACCQPLLDDNTVRRSFVSNGRCFECIQIGLDQPMYTLNESNYVYTRRLRLLAPTGYTGFARPRLRLNGIPGTAGVNDFSVVTSDILLTNPVAGVDLAITISVDGIAGEPPEMFAITFQPPGVSGNHDPLFLFRNTTVTIIDTDKPTYQFELGDYVELEGSGSAIVVNVQQIVSSVRDIHLLLVPLTYDQYIARAATDPTLAAISVYHGSRPDPAEHNVRQDFDKTVRRVLFPANSGNSASLRVSIPIMDDAIDEEQEGFIIVLYRDDNLTSIEVAFTPNLRTTLGRINDDDPFYFGFVRNEVIYDESRDEGLQELLYSPAPGNKTEKSFVFSLSLNALVGGFVFGATGDINFGVGVIRPTFTFLPNDVPEYRILTFSVVHDDVVEGQEIGQLMITPSSSFDGFGSLFQNVRIIINDSNTAVFNLSAPPVFYEQNVTFSAMITLIVPSGGSTLQIEIDVMELGITPTPFAGFRRNAQPSVVFQGTDRPGCCEKAVPYQISDDNVAEPDEILTISIARAITSASIPVRFEVQRVNVTIIDNDVARIGFETITFSVQEGAGLAELPVAVLGGTTLGREVTVRFSTSDLSAIAGSDYTSTVMELVFSAIVCRHVVRVPITKDSLFEVNEWFRASLSMVENNGLNVVVDPVLATVTIEDDDATAQNQCFPNGDDCFSGGIDPALRTYEACCQPLLDDNTVRRSFVSNGRCFECIMIGLDQPMYTLNESSTVYMRRLRLLAPTGYTGPARPRVRLNRIFGTAGVNDFSLVTSDFLLTNPVVGIDVAITIFVDGIAGEPPEMFTITNQPPGVRGNADPMFLFRNTTVTIIDTDRPAYQFDAGDYVSSEGSGNAIVVNVQQIVSSVQDIHLLLVPLTYDQYSARAATDPTLAAIDVYHGSRPDPAEYNVRQDFDMMVRRIFFSANSGNIASRRVSIPIMDDAIDEEPEGFIIVLYRDDSLTSIEVAFTPNLRTTLGRINDDDPFFFGFVLNEVTYDESRDEALQELLYSPAPGNKTEKSFVFSLNLNALQGGFEFGANGDISFGAGVIRPTFTFNPNDAPEDRVVSFSVNHDNVIEGQEIGQLKIAPSTSFDGFEPLFQNVRIIINDANTATFSLSAPPVVYEQNLTFSAMISLIAPSGGTTVQIEIDIMERGITATLFADFRRNAAPSVRFQGTERPGCCEGLVPYQVRDDNVAEPDEILTISIARAITSASIPVEFVVQQLNVTIIDNDMARIGFETITFSVQEGAGFAELPVAVLGTTTLGGEVTVRFTTSDLTAIAGSDYTNTVMELVFSASVRRHVVRVPITQDSSSELNEQLRASLSLVENNGINVVVDPILATVTIEDNDATAPVQQLLCFPNGDDCFSGSTNLTLTTYEACCQPLLVDSTTRRSFMSGGHCFECIVIGLDQPMYTLNESNTVYTRRLRLLAPTGYTGFARPRLRLNGIPGTAGVNDFSLVTSDILLTNPVAGINAAITISVDGIAGEPPEMFTITFQPPAVSSPNDPMFLFRNSIVNIIDTDRPTYQFDQGDYVESEGSGNAIVVNVQQIVSSVQDIHLLLVPLTYDQYIARAATDPTLAAISMYHSSRPDPAEHNVRQDFDSTVRRVFFSAGSGNSVSQSVSFPIMDDTITEEPEGFIIVLYRDTNLTSIEVAFTPNLRTTLGRINDDDLLFLGFVRNEVTYNEASDYGLQELLYRLAPGNKTEKLFVFSLNLNALQGGFEFGANGDISFGAGVIRPTFTFNPNAPPEDRVVTFSVIRDNVIEGQEIGQLQIAPSTSFDGFTPLFQSVRIIINDSNTAVFNLSAPPIVYEQNLSFSAMISLIAPSGGTTFQIEIDIMERGITATPFADFRRNAAPSVIFQGTEHPGCCEKALPFLVRDDNVAEPDEILAISILTSAAITVDFVMQRVNVTIIDNDMATIGFENFTFSVQEELGFAELPVAVLGSTTLGGEVTVLFSTHYISSATAGSDYTSTVTELTFSSNVQRTIARVPIIQDAFSEGTEQFRASLSLVQSNGINVTVSPDQATVDIIDDDVIDDDVTIGFAQNPVIDSREADLSATLTVRILNGSLAPGALAIVEFRTSDVPSSAVSGSDYTNTVMNLTFSSNVRRIVVRVPILQDVFCEGTEQFRASLSLVQSNGINVTVSPDQATVDIIDDDELRIGFTQQEYSGVEGDFVRPVVAISSGTLAPGLSVAVRFISAFLRARAPDDFEQTETILLFSSTNTSIAVPIPLRSDDVYERNEIFFCGLRRQPTPLNVFVYPSRAILYIIENSNVTIGFRVAAVEVPEEIGNVMLIVEVKKGQLGHTISLQYSTSDGTAIAGMDHSTTSGTITFTPTNTQQIISIPIINDMVRENRETLTVRLYNAPAHVLLAPSQASLHIIDNDSVLIGFDPKRYVFSEESGRGQFTVRVITGRLDSNVTVLLSTASCAADSGIDFSPLQDVQLIFNSTQHSITVPFDIVNDDLVENDEALMASIRLAVPVPRVSLAPDEAELTITDTDG